MRAHAVEVARKRLHDAVRSEEQPACVEILQAVRQVAPFDCATVMTADPETLLPCGGVFEGLAPEVCQPFWAAEAGPDVHRFVDLARGPSPVASLAEALPVTFEESPRFREVYAAFPLGDELRVVFGSGGACLGMAVFLRMGRGKTFSQEEQDAVRMLMAPSVELLRQEALAPANVASMGAPVIGLVRDGREVFGQTPGMEAVLSDLRGGAIGSGELPPTIIAPLARLRRKRRGATLTTRVRGSSGTWYRLHLAPVLEQPGVHTMSLEPAEPRELLPILLRSYGLTERETEVLSRLLLGLSAKQVAAELEISKHTAHDHIKAIYAKAGVRSRGELLTRLLLRPGNAPVE